MTDDKGLRALGNAIRLEAVFSAAFPDSIMFCNEAGLGRQANDEDRLEMRADFLAGEDTGFIFGHYHAWGTPLMRIKRMMNDVEKGRYRHR